MRLFNSVLSILLIAFCFSGCTATGGKEITPAKPAVHTQSEFDADTQDLQDQVDVLERVGLAFAVDAKDGNRVELKSVEIDKPVSESLQITELDRFVGMAKKYSEKYRSYTVDGKARSLSADTQSNLSEEIQVAEKALKKLQGK